MLWRNWIGGWAMVTAAAGLLAGCQSYQLRGVVVESDTPAVFVVNSDDPRLNRPGLSEVAIEATIDPDSIRPRRQGATLSDPEGRFGLPIGVEGAGFLEYQALVVARHQGYQASWQQMPLPGAGKRLLIFMAPGRDTYHPHTDLIDETWKEGQSLQDR